MRKLAFVLVALAGCVHVQPTADPCRAKTDFRPGTVTNCCGSSSWVWNGKACIQELSHCTCECTGPDCGQGYPTLNACMEAMATCRERIQ